MPILAQAQDATTLLTKPSSNQNYEMTSTPRVSGMFTSTDLTNRKTGELMQTVQYMDGLGRPLQSVSVSGSPLAYDLVSPSTYDAYGRETTALLPYTLTGTATNDGSYKSSALTSGAGQSQYYIAPPTGIAATSSPFSVAVLEASPLNRPLEQGAPGVSWQPASSGLSGSGHTQKMVYSINNAISWATDTVNSRQVALFTVTINADQSRTLTRTGSTAVYSAGQLTVTILKDENWQSGRAGTTEVYKDNDGQQVLRRVYNLTGSTLQQLSTYYVYDDLGNLSFVLPPGSMPDAGLPTQATLGNLGFQYQYDSRNRLVQKKIPGKGWEYLIYNAMDQVVATQDTNQRALSQWVYAKYDAMGRAILTGLYSSTSTRPALQSVVDGQSIFWETPVSTSSSGGGYTSAAWPVNAASFLTINYYDTYAVAGLPALYSAPSVSSINTRNLLTASQTNILGTTNMLWMVPYYDDLGRVIQSYQQHNQGGGVTLSTGNYDLVKNQYNFSNQDTATTRQHYNVAISKTAAAITIVNNYVYDHLGRKRQTWETINGGTKVLLSQLDYNELGQLMTKHLHSETGVAPFLQDVGYTYNERGWLRTQGNSSNLFSLDLRYNTPDNGITQQYNGNIAEMLYSGTVSGAKTFQYQYDPLNRLTSDVSTGNTLNETVKYDLMGNISSLTRTGSASAVLAYTYQNGGQSNQLQAVTNSGATFKSYAYDGNGNATSDGQTKTIVYNKLNLPTIIAANGKQIATFIYDSQGIKLRTTGSDGNWDYISGIVYNNNAIIFVQTEEGRVLPNGASYLYQYYLKDHLGNTRVTFKKNTNGTALNIQENEYYPFGLSPTPTIPSPANYYEYNGKEYQRDLTGYYDFGARFYDPVIARWGHIDDKAELYFQISPYAYAANNPTNAIDPNGQLVIFVSGQNMGSGNGPGYWSGFDKAVQNHFNDFNDSFTDNYLSNSSSYVEGAVNGSLYIDGALGGWGNTLSHWGNPPSNLNVNERLAAGHEHSGIDIGDLINSLKRTNGAISESIKVVAHSLGAAYARGLIASIVEYAKSHTEECRGLSITEYDFAAFQQNKLPAPEKGITLYQFDNIGDAVVGGMFGKLFDSHHAHEKGRDEKGSKDDVNPKGGHSLADYSSAISKLATGTYTFDNGEFIKRDN